jgi:hypothetical protein
LERENIAKDRKRAGAERLLNVLEQYPDLTATYPDLLGRLLRDLGADSAGKDIRAIVGLIQASDAEGQVEIRQMGKEKIAKLTDAAGKVQFEGPITTEQQRNALEIKILARITKVEKSLQMAIEGKMGNK